ncbi:MAG: DUF3048 domain-containing protein, partial [Acidimicrobiia bacterium]|nr:DUF3048 domain-containing protein [Acidimicrobiia bacterium]
MASVTESPLNGMPLPKGAEPDQRVLAIKIDNFPNARPQSGIEQADMMMEIWVEGVTRFISFWHTSDTDYVGPIR